MPNNNPIDENTTKSSASLAPSFYGSEIHHRPTATAAATTTTAAKKTIPLSRGRVVGGSGHFALFDDANPQSPHRPQQQQQQQQQVVTSSSTMFFKSQKGKKQQQHQQQQQQRKIIKLSSLMRILFLSSLLFLIVLLIMTVRLHDAHIQRAGRTIQLVGGEVGETMMTTTTIGQQQQRRRHLPYNNNYPTSYDNGRFTPASAAIRGGGPPSSISSSSSSQSYNYYYTYTDPNTNSIQRSVLYEMPKSITPQTIHYGPPSTTMSSLPTHGALFYPDPLLKVSVGEEPPVQPVYEPRGDENCVPMKDWQIDSKPNCNIIHELDLSSSGNYESGEEESIIMLGRGWFRYALQVDLGIGADGIAAETHVLKMLRYEREFLEEFYDLHRRDAMAMERLTSSPYIMDVYAFCAQSAINEFAIDTIEKFAMKMRDDWSKNIYKLYLAKSVAMGVADMHEIDYAGNNNATLVHYDLNPRNVAVVKGGHPKINDFNVAEFMMWDAKKKERCKFKGRLHEPWWRAPEEMILPKTNEDGEEEINMDHSGSSAEDNNNNGGGGSSSSSTSSSSHLMLDEKVDIYAMGNVLYRIMTGRAPRGKSIPSRIDIARNEVANGIPPRLPVRYLETKDPAIVAIRRAMRRCYRKEPSERLTAREIAMELDAVLEPMMQEIERKYAAATGGGVTIEAATNEKVKKQMETGDYVTQKIFGR